MTLQRRARPQVLFCLLFVAIAPCMAQEPVPLSIDGLRELAASATAHFERVSENPPIGDIHSATVSFVADGLREFALVLTPAGTPPADGWPVLLMNHGHHPEPKNYARIEDGSTDRPGNYYRTLPPAYAAAGFMVVVPDFRGHNDSEGSSYTGSMLEATWYARDSVTAFKALPSLANADTSRVFTWGHSMGGEVALRMVLALGGQIRAASLWSTVAGDLWEQTVHYSFTDTGVAVSSSEPVAAVAKLAADIAALPFPYSPEQGDPTLYLDELQAPLILHHAVGDLWGTPYGWSVDIVTGLIKNGKTYEFFSYPGNDHLLKDEQQRQAIERDVQFFRRFLK